ncbi:uncharacterized protein FTOL_08464 [Fusarium torulosum]|uniref:Uncharacterized protein n=1 Tax=Fusarium torulosum TaxID=33205 RepID=A0AAE8MDC1_9HYPO|nr:uncharacterized protein FTOL_08464 [Fusarium torulosum]
MPLLALSADFNAAEMGNDYEEIDEDEYILVSEFADVKTRPCFTGRLLSFAHERGSATGTDRRVVDLVLNRLAETMPVPLSRIRGISGSCHSSSSQQDDTLTSKRTPPKEVEENYAVDAGMGTRNPAAAVTATGVAKNSRAPYTPRDPDPP